MLNCTQSIHVLPFFFFFFSNREVCNLNLAQFKLQQNLVNDCNNDLQSVSKLRNCRSFKSNFIKVHDTIDIPKPHRSILTQFMCSVLPIRIETMRFRGEEVNNMLCIICPVEAFSIIILYM